MTANCPWFANQGRMEIRYMDKTGNDLLNLATTREGEEYVYGADVPLDDQNWHGPWDCAELASWVARQVTGKLYGCLDADTDNPDPWTGAWARDARNGKVQVIPVSRAAKTPGALLLRYRQGGHHIVFAVGDGRTFGAQNGQDGVTYERVGGLDSWDYGILLPGVTYGNT